MTKPLLLALPVLLTIFLVGNVHDAFADLVVVQTGNGLDGYVNAEDDGTNGGTSGDNVPDSGITSLTHTQTFMTSGVSYDLAFDLTATNGFLNSADSDTIGVWATAGEADGGGTSGSLNANNLEALTVDNIAISNIIGGTATFDSISRVGISFATSADDAGAFAGGGILGAITWDELDDGDDFDDGSLNLDGAGSGDTFNLQDANSGLPVSSFTLTATGGAYRLDAVEFDVSVAAAVPEPSSAAILLAVGPFGFLRRRRR